MIEMPPPVGGYDLVLDQGIDRRIVRHPQERLRQAHQRHALFRRQGIFRQEPFHEIGRRRGPEVSDKRRCPARNCAPVFDRQSTCIDETANDFGFIGDDIGADVPAQDGQWIRSMHG